MVVRDAAGVALLGFAIGTAGAFIATRSLRTLLFGIEPGDPHTLGLAAIVLLVAALLASWVPAHRAARVDPMQALRTE
jgi:putative ABC transport system permease protein